MPTEPRFDIDRVRAFAKERVEMMSLRAVAADIGMSYTGLFSFLHGGEPYSRNRRQLATWYVRASHPQAKTIKPEEIDAAVALLEEYIYTGTSEAQAERRAADVVNRIMKSHRRPVPTKKQGT
jgi:hypothetical protein